MSNDNISEAKKAIVNYGNILEKKRFYR